MRQARSRAVGQSSTRMVSMRRSCTARSPASLSTSSVVGIEMSSVRKSVVLPTPGGPTITIFAPLVEPADSSDIGDPAVLKLDDLVAAAIWKRLALRLESGHAAHLRMRLALMAYLAEATNRRSLPVIITGWRNFGTRPFVKDGEEAGDVLDNLSTILAVEMPLGAWLPQADCAIDQTVICCA